MKNICKKCVMPEAKPHIFLNNEGICNICIEYEKEQDLVKPLESDFVKLLNKYKGKGKYDCLVMCSGGKDSTSALYYMKKRYKLNPLAFTFDHGFETEEAIENIKKAVEILGVDFLFYKTDYIQDMFFEILNTGSKAVLCHPCSMWYMNLSFEMAAKFDIPIIIAGWTKGQSTKQSVMSKCGCNIHQPEFHAMGKETTNFLKIYQRKNPKYKNFPTTMEEVLTNAKKKYKNKKAIVLSPHWFLPFDTETNIKTIKEELDWKQTKESYPENTTNCKMNFVSVYLSMKNYGYTHYHVEMSKMIREGLMTREQALNDLELKFDKEYLNSIVNKLNYKFD